MDDFAHSCQALEDNKIIVDGKKKNHAEVLASSQKSPSLQNKNKHTTSKNNAVL